MPSGGVRWLSRYVDVLCRHGHDACPLNQASSFGCSWFASDAPVHHFGQTPHPPRSPRVPEVCEPDIALLEPEVPMVIFNQESQVARGLSQRAIVLAAGTAEGCPLPPLEAMASGCVMVGYHGAGGREYFDPSFSIAIEAVDVLRFLMEVND